MKTKFRDFISTWNETQNQKTPEIHIKMADWLEWCWENEKHKMLLMAFRSAGKSTIVGLFAAWMLHRDPNIRILVLAADFTLAKKMVHNVRRIIERHPQTTNLKPTKAEQWASDRFTIERSKELRDPSMLAKGIVSNITGSRADVIICDDVEVPNTSDSQGKREDLRERLREIPYVLVAGGTQLYVGTPHHFYSIYADLPREDVGEKVPFLNNYERLSIPIIDEQGNPAYPEKYTKEGIEQIKIDTGPNKFDSQMMLKYINLTEGRLDADALKKYTGDLEYCKIENALFLGPSSEMEYASCWWDPALGKANGDDSVLVLLYTDKGGYKYIHHIEYIKVDERSDLSEADQQIEIVTRLTEKYHIPSIIVETNGIGGLFPGMLEKELRKMNSRTSVQRVHTRKNKVNRILESFDALLAAQKIYVHERIWDTNFIADMREWKPDDKGNSKGKDDALDAAAGALSGFGQVRLKSFFTRSFTGATTHQGQKDWDVD